MTLNETHAFLKDIQKVLEKHGLALMSSGNPERLIKETKHLEGFHFFFTKGEVKAITEDKEKYHNPSVLTLNVLKQRDNEDDGN